MGRSLAALDGLNFFLADVQSGLGPFLGIYLLTKTGLERRQHRSGHDQSAGSRAWPCKPRLAP
jgi:hypothetical protein